MSKSFNYKIIGKVIDKSSKTGIKGLLIKAWDADLIVDDLIGGAPTNYDGIFTMEFDISYFKDIFLDRRPDLYFEIYYKGVCIYSTQNGVMFNLKPGEHEVELIIDFLALTEEDSEKPVYPNPRQDPNIPSDDPVGTGIRIIPPKSGKWKMK